MLLAIAAALSLERSFSFQHHDTLGYPMAPWISLAASWVPVGAWSCSVRQKLLDRWFAGVCFCLSAPGGLWGAGGCARLGRGLNIELRMLLGSSCPCRGSSGSLSSAPARRGGVEAQHIGCISAVMLERVGLEAAHELGVKCPDFACKAPWSCLGSTIPVCMTWQLRLLQCQNQGRHSLPQLVTLSGYSSAAPERDAGMVFLHDSHHACQHASLAVGLCGVSWGCLLLLCLSACTPSTMDSGIPEGSACSEGPH